MGEKMGHVCLVQLKVYVAGVMIPWCAGWCGLWSARQGSSMQRNRWGGLRVLEHGTGCCSVMR